MEQKLFRIFVESKNDFEVVSFDSNACICTGLTDSKDKLIFEGDILLIEEEENSYEEEEQVIVKNTAIVQFDKGAFGIRLLQGGYYGYDDLSQLLTDSHIVSVCVIGNIFQEKDILKINNK